ncbi:hypothetical protein [Oceanobacillus indicireducens]|uniref:MerR family transcriptional regulator n=1 Tax=Oceanobacillus indicireducens TaxID=1004261 RepID=A0A918D1X9_9BACI|nr:hypothetical protein [Oceanobacillus indicireducens]GGN59193.1 MerR family transcriptional regulator [Oceanobacillus indicireducens]
MYSIGKLAEISKTTIRTLRYYDEEAFAKLYYILTLKEIDFPLKQIKTIITNQEKSPMELLQMQMELIQSEIKQFKKNKHTLESFIQVMELGGHKNWEDIFNTFKHISPVNSKFTEKRQKYFTNEELEILNTLPKVGQDTPVVSDFINLFREIRQAIADEVNPSSKKGQQLANKWFEIAKEMYGENAATAKKAYQVYRTKKENLGFVYLDEDVISFIEDAYDHQLKGDGNE